MRPKILIIEDSPIIAENLKGKLESLDYSVIGITDSKEEAVDLVIAHQPKLILAEIILATQEYDGIDIVKQIFKSYRIPVIYLTANSELTTVKKATTSQPAAFLLKPYRLKELVVNIEIILKKFEEITMQQSISKFAEDSIFISEQFIHHRVYKKNIKYIEADGSYTSVFTTKKTYKLTLNLKHFTLQLADPNFIRISRKHVVNVDHISRIDGNTLYLDDDNGFTISKTNRHKLLVMFPILRSR
jgi:DNA-binding LytR/AlgR family response regulator